MRHPLPVQLPVRRADLGNLSDGLPAWTYSLTYNGSYMLPETILTTVAAVLIYKAAPQLFAAQEQ